MRVGFGRAAAVVLMLAAPARPVAAADEPRPASGSPRGDDIDLGTAVVAHREMTAGLFSVSLGLGDRVQMGTRVVPWFVGLIAPGSIVPNGFVKGLLMHSGQWSAAIETSVLYAKLDDLDRDGLNVRAWLWPTRALVGSDWTPCFATTLELTGIYTAVTAQSPVDTDTRVEGVALARAAYVGLLPRYRLAKWLTLWTRTRVLLGHSPVVASARSRLSERSRIEIEARADAAELTSGVAMVGGVHLHWPWLSVTAAGGYGTWFLPWIYLPVGESTAIVELDFYFRF